jgi:hypothetical protein
MSVEKINKKVLIDSKKKLIGILQTNLLNPHTQALCCGNYQGIICIKNAIDAEKNDQEKKMCH